MSDIFIFRYDFFGAALRADFRAPAGAAYDAQLSGFALLPSLLYCVET
jgi:hypothetical protein